MTVRSVLVVALALVFGGSAAVGVSALRQQAPAAAPPETVPVVVAAVDVPRGTVLTGVVLKVREWPKDMVPPGVVTKLEEALERVVFIPVMKDEPVLEAKLAPKGAGRGLAALIPNGMRAFTIQTPNVSTGVAGFILPGNKVDVLLTVSGSGSNDATGGGSSTTLFQNVEILAVDQRVDAPSENKVDVKDLRSVTLLVTPDQQAKLNLAQNKGTLHLSLRNLQDSLAADTRPATLADLRLYHEKPKEVAPALAPPPPEPLQIRTLRGGHDGAVYIHPSGSAAGGR